MSRVEYWFYNAKGEVKYKTTSYQKYLQVRETHPKLRYETKYIEVEVL